MAEKSKTRDPANQVVLDGLDKSGVDRLGLMNNQVWKDDPRRLVFTLARYKFVSKMFSGFTSVLEVACGDGFASRVVQQEVSKLTAVDFDPVFIEDAKTRMHKDWPFDVRVHDILAGPVEGVFDGIYSLDFLEHISPGQEGAVIENMKASLAEHGTMILGMPSLESQDYASPPSKVGHINCKSGEDFRALMGKHFHNVFMFSMNDEVVHTGFFPMSHYLFALCCSKK